MAAPLLSVDMCLMEAGVWSQNFVTRVANAVSEAMDFSDDDWDGFRRSRREPKERTNQARDALTIRRPLTRGGGVGSDNQFRRTPDDSPARRRPPEPVTVVMWIAGTVLVLELLFAIFLAHVTRGGQPW